MPSLASLTSPTKPYAVPYANPLAQPYAPTAQKFAYTPDSGAARTDANGAFAAGGDTFNMGGTNYSANDILSRFNSLPTNVQNGLYGDTTFGNALAVNMGRDAANNLIQSHSAGGQFYDPNAGQYSWGAVQAGNYPGAPAASTSPQSTSTTTLGSVANGTTDPYALDINKYLAPNTSFLIDQGSKALQNSAASRGGLLTGNTMKGISDYAQNTAQSAYNNAAQLAAQQQGFQYGVDNNDRNFAYQAALNDRNFNNSNLMSLANMGLQGSQADSALNQWL